MKRRFGRLPFVPDKRDDSYTAQRLAAMIDLGLAEPVTWANLNRVLDQGEYGTCVSAGILGLLNTDDERHNDPQFTDKDILEFFAHIEGGDVLRGAYVRNGLKAAQQQGYVAAYGLLRSTEEVESWLLEHGPVLVGTLWTTQMSRPQGGVVTVDSLHLGGGHCWFLHGYDTTYLHGSNSWGEDWGLHGRFLVAKTGWRDLYRANGEAWAVLQPVKPPAPPLSCWKKLIRRLGRRL